MVLECGARCQGTIIINDVLRFRYQQDVTNTRQPLIVSERKESDQHKGKKDPILLVPEFCVMTGLNDQMRANFSLMKDLSNHLFQPPERKFNATVDFVRRLRGSAQVSC